MATRVSLPSPGQTCVARVKISKVETRTRRFREYKAAHEGRDPTICAAPAYRVIDGEPLCRGHAGARAIRILEEEI